MGPHGSPRRGVETVANRAPVLAFCSFRLFDGAGGPGVMWNGPLIERGPASGKGREGSGRRAHRVIGLPARRRTFTCSMPSNSTVTKRAVRRAVSYRQHVPPDVTAQIFWLKNRNPAH